MKKFLISIFFLFSTFISAMAGWETPSNLYKELKKSDVRVYIFNSLNGSSISYTFDKETTFTWKKYTTSPSSAEELKKETKTLAELSDLENATGYILEYQDEKMETVQMCVWVLDYSEFRTPQVQITSIADKSDFVCSETVLEGTLEVTAPKMTYVDKSGISHDVEPYEIFLKYNTLHPKEKTFELEEEEKEVSLNVNGKSFSVSLDDVYENTPFTIVLKDMKGETVLAESAQMTVDNLNVKPLVSVVGNLTIREKDDDEMYNKNEKDKGIEEEHRDIEGSAPLDIQLQMYKNDVVGEIAWKIYKDERNFRDTLVRRNETVLNEEDFSKVGKYIVKVIGQSANGCIAMDSIKITIGDGTDDILLEVPNVFTPNDDGLNDEFRVAYRSILKFEMYLYNRWGRMLYHSKDPAKGWDGKIGGKEAAVGVYFYVIKATGADGKEYDREGSVNLLR